MDELPPQNKESDGPSSSINEKKINDSDNDKKNKRKSATKKKEKAETVPLIKLFRFATPSDILFMFAGTIGALGNGIAIPVMSIIFSGFIQTFLDYNLAINTGQPADGAVNKLEDGVKTYAFYFIALGCSIFVCANLQMCFWIITGERQTKRIRTLFYSSIIHQDIEFFDDTSTGDITTRVSGDISILQEGMSEKVGFIIQQFTCFIGGFIVALVKVWKLTLVLCSVLPLLAISGVVISKSLSSDASEGQDAYAAAGGVAEQVLSGIRTVVAFGGEQREIQRYISKLEIAYKFGKRKSIVNGLGMGFMLIAMFGSYGLAFWYGSILIVNGEENGGDILNAFFAVMIGAFSIGNAAPYLASVSNALGAAAKIYKIIDRVPKIDSSADKGKKFAKSELKGFIEFKNISFSYPSRPDIQVLKDFNLTIEPGQTVALVGSSGSGKSTIVGLIERFYDPLEGEILFDGIKIKDINIKSLRTQIGMVGQEPVLFPETIKQNIIWGADPDDAKEPSLDEIIEVCKRSNAHDFIDELPNKYDTLVGEKGSLISGGQKQRLAIARALIKNPPILLLDEATSALDTESEGLVQEALDKASTNRTTIVIAHRLSTIKNADKIVVMSKGEIKEIGKHDELIEREEDETSVIIDDNSNKLNLKRLTTKASTTKSVKLTDEEIEKDRLEKLKQKTPLGRVFNLNKSEWYLIVPGSIGAIFTGSVMPLFALVFSSILEVFSRTDDPDGLRSKANFWASMFAVLALVAGLANFCQIALFSLSAEKLTKRLRIMTFTSLVKQEVAFFDDEKNGTGVLTSKLAVDASKVEGLTGSLMGSIIQNATNLVLGLGIAFYFGWKLTLVILAASPIIAIAGYLEFKALAGFGTKTSKAYESTGQIVQQSVSNMRTIASLSREETFKNRFIDALREPHKIAIKGSTLVGFGFGASQGFVYFIWSLAFWYGSRLIISGEYTTETMFRVLFVVIFSAVAVGQMSSFAPNTANAKVAAISIFEIIDRKSKIDATDSEGKDRPTPVTGESTIKDVHFNYPARPDIKILKGLDMSVDAGKTIALVGSSGSGKSTVVSLLLRFYDVNSGSVEVEKVDVKTWNLEYLRSNLALVGQEPILFDLTIGENIAYGKEGASQDEIENAAKGANIHDFIMSLTDKYDTKTGEKGTQLSGGQKQRVAIARALIRSPKLLLLDEATSALDSESEKVVQVALDKASKGRTTLTIAHRLSTIQNADLILVCKKGKIVESGKHSELISQKGLYYDLVNRQTLTNQAKTEVVPFFDYLSYCQILSVQDIYDIDYSINTCGRRFMTIHKSTIVSDELLKVFLKKCRNCSIGDLDISSNINDVKSISISGDELSNVSNGNVNSDKNNNSINLTYKVYHLKVWNDLSPSILRKISRMFHDIKILTIKFCHYVIINNRPEIKNLIESQKSLQEINLLNDSFFIFKEIDDSISKHSETLIMEISLRLEFLDSISFPNLEKLFVFGDQNDIRTTLDLKFCTKIIEKTKGNMKTIRIESNKFLNGTWRYIKSIPVHCPKIQKLTIFYDNLNFLGLSMKEDFENILRSCKYLKILYVQEFHHSNFCFLDGNQILSSLAGHLSSNIFKELHMIGNWTISLDGFKIFCELCKIRNRKKITLKFWFDEGICQDGFVKIYENFVDYGILKSLEFGWNSKKKNIKRILNYEEDIII
ncbi:3661_t:CDS:10 [Entrophospora sp. SA101]|nr:3661_t:CDS:10 [Entrophospora sp. SA101]